MTVERTLGVGGDYATVRDALVAIDAAGLLTDNWDIDVISDTTDAVVIPAGTFFIRTNGFRVRFWSSYNYENRDDWTRWYQNSTSVSLLFLAGAQAGSVELEYLRIRQTGSNRNTIQMSSLNPYDAILKVSNCYIRGPGRLATSGYGIVINGEWYQYRLVNTRIWNFRYCFYLLTTGIGPGEYADRRFIEHCIAYFGQRGFYSGDDSNNLPTFRNCAAGDCTGGAFYGQSVSERWVVDSCACDDGTLLYGTNIYNALVLADEFATLDDTERLFLGLANDGTKTLSIAPVPPRGKAPLEVKFTTEITFDYGTMGPVLPASGTKAAYSTADLRGNERPGEDDRYSIGVDEPVFSWVIND